MVLLTLCAAAVLPVVAGPVARVLVEGAPGVSSVSSLAAAITAFAPGLVGYGLLALLSRALYARGDGRTPAVATVVGWLGVAVADVLLVVTLPDVQRVVLLGIGNTVGLTVAGALLLAGLRRAAGPGSLAGAARTTMTAALAAAAALALALLLPTPDGPVLLADLGLAASHFLATVLVYVVVVRLLQPSAIRELTGD